MNTTPSGKFTLRRGHVYTLADFSSSHQEILLSCNHSGSCDEDCSFAAQYFDCDNYPEIREYLLESGIEEKNLKSDKDCLEFLLWIVSGDIQERGEAFIGG